MPVFFVDGHAVQKPKLAPRRPYMTKRKKARQLELDRELQAAFRKEEERRQAAAGDGPSPGRSPFYWYRGVCSTGFIVRSAPRVLV